MKSGPLVHCALVLAALSIACTPGGNLMTQAEFLCVEERWAEAEEVLKQALLADPDHPGAHFLLGRCYLRGRPFLPLHAEGEILTALDRFQRARGRSSLTLLAGARFELECHLEMAEIYLKQIELLILDKGPPLLARPLIRKCRSSIEAARQITADSKNLQDIERRLADLIKRAEEEGRRQYDDRYPVTAQGPLVMGPFPRGASEVAQTV